MNADEGPCLQFCGDGWSRFLIIDLFNICMSFSKRPSEFLQIPPVTLCAYVVPGYKQEVEDYVASVFEQNKDPKLLYHNFHHTSKVVQRAVEIASFYKIDEESLFVLVAAGWFHDIGYLFVGPRNHEQEGVKMMITFWPGSGIHQPCLKRSRGS